jgi:hypothetical protein
MLTTGLPAKKLLNCCNVFFAIDNAECNRQTQNENNAADTHSTFAKKGTFLGVRK